MYNSVQFFYKFLVGVFCVALLTLSNAKAQEDAPLSDRRVSYQLHVSLDEATRTFHGSGTMSWRNPDAVPVDSLQFHLYLNAFRDSRTTFMREMGESINESDAGGIELTQLESTDGTNLLSGLFYLRPGDGNPSDETVAAVVLAEPVMPGQEIELKVAFISKLPRIVARTGYEVRKDGSLFVMAAQWFPKFGFYEPPGHRYVPAESSRGRWSTHQFHANSEFYADFGSYDITIDVPEDFVVGATGVLTETEAVEGRRFDRYIAEDVHDFAWTASPAFLEYTDRWRNVSLRLLIQPEHRGQVTRHFDAARVALEGYDRLVGAYPYPVITLVDGLGDSNGMEYPTLILCGTSYGAPEWFRLTELLIIHEFGHQYFYGVLASNEAEEAWLDEGINSYVEGKVMDEHYGQGSVLDGVLPIGNADYHWITYAKDDPHRGALVTKSWEYSSRNEYGRVSYSKSATVLHALEGYLGSDVMLRLMRTYYEHWRFRHPTTRDFQAIAEEVSNQDLGWFFDQYVYGTAVVDYSVTEISSEEADDGSFLTTVEVSRLRDGVFPQTVMIEFENDSTEEYHWDGRTDTTFVVQGTVRARRAVVDPTFKVALDINRLNNGKAIGASSFFRNVMTERLTVFVQYFLRGMESLF